jgi:putative serine protease PepD
MSTEAPGPDSRSGPKFRGPLLIPLVIGLLGAVIGSGATLLVAGRGDSASPNPVVRVGEGSTNGEPLTGVAEVAKAVLPSVVRIDVGPSGPLRRQGAGSGVIFRSDGYIITNDHVVSRGDDIKVTLSSGEELDARLVGTASPSDDIAVIKVEERDLVSARLGSTKDLSVGDLAVALGSPFGLEGTVTAGVVSALHRNVTLGRGARFTDAIQTDAPINPGNSGGALANSKGEVIGINTAILGVTLGGGVGFAIPIEIAQSDAEQIIETGRAVRPFLGIAGETIPNDGGARIQEALPGGGAAEAGITEGDVITEVEGTKIGSMDDIVSVLRRFKVGDKVTVVHKRGDETRTAEVELRPPPEE